MDDSFSLVISVYTSDNPDHFCQAMDSVLLQSHMPEEIILMVDGPINNMLNEKVVVYENNPLIKVFRLEKNIGLGAARHQAILCASTPIIAVMDSDDISVFNRFELQIEAINNTVTDVVGGYIAEFSNSHNKIDRIRAVPITHEEIIKRGRFFSPINHVTIMFKKESYLRSGGYKGLRKIEDYDLFHHMVSVNLKFYNIPEVLVYVRATDDQYLRRHGISYYREEIGLHTEMYKSGYIGLVCMFWNLIIRLPVRFLPVSVLRGLSKKVLRASIEK